MDTRYGLNYSGRHSGGIELCRVTINTADKRVIAAIRPCTRGSNETRIFSTDTSVSRTEQISWNRLSDSLLNGFFCPLTKVPNVINCSIEPFFGF